jgi:L-asparaginase
MHKTQSILIIYTGGTIGMIQDAVTGELTPVNFPEISKHLPELGRFDLNIDAISFTPPVDSSEVEPDMWIRMASIIEQNYDNYDGFVILHGTDTMAYSASALSFLLENLDKPVVFTGSQLPLGMLRTDGKENLISSIEIASAKEGGSAIVPEVCIFFQNKLFRGNRTTKHNVEYFNAFRSDNYPVLAETGINIRYDRQAIMPSPGRGKLKVHKELCTDIALLKIFPGISEKAVRAIYNIDRIKAVIMETYGAGNAPTRPWFLSLIREAISKGIIILNISQCSVGSVDMSLYKTGKRLSEAGVFSGLDITSEAAVTKMMFILAHTSENKRITSLVNTSLRGEIS